MDYFHSDLMVKQCRSLGFFNQKDTIREMSIIQSDCFTVDIVICQFGRKCFYPTNSFSIVYVGEVLCRSLGLCCDCLLHYAICLPLRSGGGFCSICPQMNSVTSCLISVQTLMWGRRAQGQRSSLTVQVSSM